MEAQNLQLIQILTDIDKFITKAAVARVDEKSENNRVYSSYEELKAAVARGETTDCSEYFFEDEMNNRIERVEVCTQTYNETQDLLKEYIATIPEHQRKEVYETLKTRKQLFAEITQLRDDREKTKKLKSIGIECSFIYSKPTQLASALSFASTPAIHQLHKQLEQE